jgi:hypothetical protein
MVSVVHGIHGWGGSGRMIVTESMCFFRSSNAGHSIDERWVVAIE